MITTLVFVYDKQKIFIDCNSSQFMYKYIKEHKTFFEESFLWWLKTIMPENSVIIDIGAHIGNHTIYFSKMLKAKKVIAIEPTKVSYELLLKNIEQNNLKGVEAHRVAITYKEGDAYCEVIKTSNLGANRWRLSREKKSCGVVSAMTLQHIVDEPQIDLIKIDVETSELEVIEGAIDLIDKHSPYLMVEIFRPNLNKFEKLMKDLNYKYIGVDFFKKNRKNKADTLLLKRRI